MANVTGSVSRPLATSGTKTFGYACITPLIVKKHFINRVIRKVIAPSCTQLNRDDIQYRYNSVLYAGIGARGHSA
jgi:hypothetical protein